MKWIVLVLAFMVAPLASAQTSKKWNETDLALTPPTTCTDGSPVATNCPITGYRIERATSATGPWTTVITLPSSGTTHRAIGLPAGTNHFRFITLSSSGESAPSNSVSSVNTPSVPSPGTLRVVEPTAFEIRPNSTGTMVATRIGIIPEGSLCSSETQAAGNATYNRVDSRSVDLVNWPAAKVIEAWARCG